MVTILCCSFLSFDDTLFPCLQIRLKSVYLKKQQLLFIGNQKLIKVLGTKRLRCVFKSMQAYYVVFWKADIIVIGKLDTCRLLIFKTILKAITNATGTSVIFTINISLIHFIFVLTSVPNVGERFTKT